MSLNPGDYGQTRETWRTMSLRKLLRAIVAKHPTWSREQILSAYLERGADNDECVTEALRRCFDNDYRAMMRPSAKRAMMRPSAKPLVTSDEVIAAKARLLDLVLSNDKQLRDCNGAECRREGGWLVRIADRIGDKGIVGQVLNESQLKKLRASSS